MADLATKEITLVDEASSIDSNARIYIDNNGSFQRANFDAFFKNTDSFSAVMGNFAAHNNIFRGSNLTSVYSIDQIYEKVSSGSFDDLYLGDYITVSITTTLPDGTVKTESVDLTIAAFNYYYALGDTSFAKQHIVLIPRASGFATMDKMNSSNTTEGGYSDSYMHKTLLPCYAESLNTALNGHVLTYRDWLTNAVATGSPSMAGAGFTGSSSSCAWEDVTLQLMNEAQVYGSAVWGSSAYDVGCGNKQFPIFRFINPQKYGRKRFWLRSIVSTSQFAVCSHQGNAFYYSASQSSAVSPIIVFG